MLSQQKQSRVLAPSTMTRTRLIKILLLLFVYELSTVLSQESAFYCNTLGPEWLDRDRAASTESRGRHRRAATSEAYRLWTTKRVPYVVSTAYNSYASRLIRVAMDQWESHTCIRFVPRTNESDYVMIVKGDGCCSAVGRKGGPQTLSLADGCMRLGIILHELGHLIGFWHEQSRPDRDAYVSIMYDNIERRYWYNFDKRSPMEINSLDQAYDYSSVMHYRNDFFSSNGLQTMGVQGTAPLEMDGVMGSAYNQKHGVLLSQSDILQTNILYRCPRVSTCGGVLFGESGSARWWPSLSKSSHSTCQWVISSTMKQAQRNQIGVVRFDRWSFDEHHLDCDANFLEVRQGQGPLAKIASKFCLNQRPRDVIVDGPHIFIRLVLGGTKSSNWLQRMSFNYEFQSCFKAVNQNNQPISSRELTNNHPNFLRCRWTFQAPDGFKLRLRLQDMNIPPTSSYLSQERFSTSTAATGYSEHRGSSSSQPAQNHPNHDGHADWRPIQSDPSMREFAALPPLSQPSNYGSQDFPSNACVLIQAEAFNGSEIVHRFCRSSLAEDLVLDSGRAAVVLTRPNQVSTAPSFRFQYDFEDIDECQQSPSPCDHVCMNFRGGYVCGCRHGYRATYLPTSSKLSCIDINECSESNPCSHSCQNQPGTFACSCPPGFVLQNNQRTCEQIPGCAVEYRSELGSILSSSFFGHQQFRPGPRQTNFSCIWRIKPASTDASAVLLKVRMPRTDGCSGFLRLRYTRLSAEDPTESVICSGGGVLHEIVVPSRTVDLHMELTAPYSLPWEIFYSTQRGRDCDHLLRSGSGVVESPGFPSNYGPNLNCEWRLEADHRPIAVHFEAFSLEQGHRCHFDYVSVEIPDPSSPGRYTSGRFCGTQIPPNLVVPPHAHAIVRFRSDATVSAAGFRARFHQF